MVITVEVQGGTKIRATRGGDQGRRSRGGSKGSVGVKGEIKGGF